MTLDSSPRLLLKVERVPRLSFLLEVVSALRPNSEAVAEIENTKQNKNGGSITSTSITFRANEELAETRRIRRFGHPEIFAGKTVLVTGGTGFSETAY
ncbi:hypothetical protein EVAR_87535_1 [Eumeta japonica]|uniref:Uncharacterized protein n=1 Tax=Eumeta variegata TaxID=151549 RepID=A0A4C1XTP9_EUMVA|nr:hypothetical protein EVAR_87535_1 [Eumeta japonica]